MNIIKSKYWILFLVLALILVKLNAQSQYNTPKFVGKKVSTLDTVYFDGSRGVTIPGYTGYAIPEENDEDLMFNEKVGLHNWVNPLQTISYYFKINKAGQLHLSFMVKNKHANTLTASIAGQSFAVQVPKGHKFAPVNIGDAQIPQPGFYQLTFKCDNASAKHIADIQSIHLYGSATADIQFNAKPRRNAGSVHLNYPFPDSLHIVSFYNEVTIPKGADIPYTYYMACGFERGYFGIQVNSDTERRVIFSVWDAGNEAVDRNKVSDTNRVRLIAKGDGVFASDFGNEGTGGHSHWVYNWKADTTYKFLVTALPDSASNTTTYSGYFYAPELKAWKFLASFRAPKDGKYLHHLYSFLEDFVGISGQQSRKGYYNNQWVQGEENGWIELNKATFSCDATGRAKDRIDFGGGTENNKFYLWNGGFKPGNANYGDTFTRKAIGVKPATNLYHNVDSLLQAQKDIETIQQAVKDGTIDTTGSINGVFYKILSQGTGRKVQVTDTLSVYYKGWALNGEVFDSTEKEPAVFPLNRLIKGWQYALPMCNVGGRIRVILPSGLGYSIRNVTLKIPPNSILVFDIEVLNAREAKQTN